MESMHTKHEWNGDVDLGDGVLQKQHEAYSNRLRVIDGLCCQVTGDRQRQQTSLQLHAFKASIKNDPVFIIMIIDITYVLCINPLHPKFPAERQSVSGRKNRVRLRSTPLPLRSLPGGGGRLGGADAG